MGNCLMMKKNPREAARAGARTAVCPLPRRAGAAARLRLMAVLAGLWALALCAAVAQEVETPARLLRVSSLAELTDGGVYAIVGMDNEENRVLLSSGIGKNAKAVGVALEDFAEEEIRVDRADCLWQLEREGTAGHVARLAPADGSGFLTRKTDGLGLTLSDDTDAGSLWQITAGDSGFVCAAPGAEDRSLLAMVNGNSHVSYFDNYYHFDYVYPELYIYKLPATPLPEYGEAVMPAQGARVAIAAAGVVRTQAGQAEATGGTLLCDGTLAPAASVQIWTARVTGETTFTLEGADGYLGYGLQATAEAAVWQIARGNVCTQEAAPRYLRYDGESGLWRLTENSGEGNPAFLMEVAEEPRREVDAQGVCTLTGGWGADALAALDLTGVRCLDLTRTHLPVGATAFAATPETRNLPVFVAGAETAYVPEAWNLAVACGTRNELLRGTELRDREPLFTDRTIHVAAGSLTYRREGCTPGQWQTVCLPMAAEVTAGTAFGLEGADGEELLFSQVETLKAGVGYIVLPDGSGNFAAVAAGGDLQTLSAAGTGLTGVFGRLTLTETDAPAYFLAPGGGAFCRAAAGSLLPPFRAMLRLDGAEAMRVRFRQP